MDHTTGNRRPASLASTLARLEEQVENHPNGYGIGVGLKTQKMRGSRKGYNADIENTPTEEDEASVAAGSSRVERVRFYSHVVPRRRTKHTGRSIAPRAHLDIDLSMVSLLSSKEMDQRSFTFGSSTSVNNDDSSSSASCQANYKAIVNKTKRVYPEARPLAVIDYGSIDLDMSGSLLDSFYKIDTIGVGSGGSRDVVLRGRKFFFNDESKAKNYDDVVCKTQTRASEAEEARYSAMSVLNPGAFPAANRRNAEVTSIIASLKSDAIVNRFHCTTPRLEHSECKKLRIAHEHLQKSVCIPVLVKLPTTLEAAISFSPFAR